MIIYLGYLKNLSFDIRRDIPFLDLYSFRIPGVMLVFLPTSLLDSSRLMEIQRKFEG